MKKTCCYQLLRSFHCGCVAAHSKSCQVCRIRVVEDSNDNLTKHRESMQGRNRRGWWRYRTSGKAQRSLKSIGYRCGSLYVTIITLAFCWNICQPLRFVTLTQSQPSFIMIFSFFRAHQVKRNKPVGITTNIQVCCYCLLSSQHLLALVSTCAPLFPQVVPFRQCQQALRIAIQTKVVPSL